MRKVIGRDCTWGLGISWVMGRDKRGRNWPPAVIEGAARGLSGRREQRGGVSEANCLITVGLK
jgi:hypothetical protein